MNIKQAMTVSAIIAAIIIAIPSVSLADDDKVDMASVVLKISIVVLSTTSWPRIQLSLEAVVKLSTGPLPTPL